MLLSAALSCAVCSISQARVGESLTTLNDRLTASGTGARLPKHELLPKRDKSQTRVIEEAFTEDLGMLKRPDGGSVISPLKMLEMLPPSMRAELIFYLKSDTGKATGVNVASLRNWDPSIRPVEKPRNGPSRGLAKEEPVLNDALNELEKRFTGWELMVVAVDGVSVLEVYRRIGNYVSPAEFEGLLKINGGERIWSEVAKKDNRSEQSLFAYDYETADGQLRARQFGTGSTVNAVMIFNGPMGERLKEIQSELKQTYFDKRNKDLINSLDRF